MTRLYIELKPEMRDVASREELSQDFVMDIAREILEVRLCERQMCERANMIVAIPFEMAPYRYVLSCFV
jgi:hypothetical protein